MGLFLKGLLFAGYQGTYGYATRTGINLVDVHGYSAGGKWLAAIVLFLGVDCAYYWFHRIAHEYNAPWAGHVVHHSSEDYNLAVALRQGTFQGLFSWVFYLPLALVGFPPAWFAAMSSFDTLYQFWIHTRAIGKLGPLEWVLNTPSHHRVHHGRNPKYLDKNYAGTLIIWDRMFGTFQAEEEEPVYGLTKPLEQLEPAVGQPARVARPVPRRLAGAALGRQAPDLVHAAGLAARGIARQPRRPRGDAPDRHPLRHAIAARIECLRAGCISWATLPLAVGLLAAGRSLARGELVVAAVLVLWALLNIGGIFDHRRWALPSELLRLPVTAAALAARLPDGVMARARAGGPGAGGGGVLALPADLSPPVRRRAATSQPRDRAAGVPGRRGHPTGTFLIRNHVRPVHFEHESQRNTFTSGRAFRNALKPFVLIFVPRTLRFFNALHSVSVATPRSVISICATFKIRSLGIPARWATVTSVIR